MPTRLEFRWLLIFFVILAGLFWFSRRPMGPIPTGAAKQLTAEKWFNTDSEVSLAKLAGKVIVLEFWATWCGPCIQNIPHLNAIHDHWKDRGVVVVAVTDEPPDRVAEFIHEKEIRYIVGAGSRLIYQYGVSGIPYSLIINRDGKVVWGG